MKKLIAIILVLISLGSYAQTPPRTGYLVQTAKWKFVNPIWLDSGAYITKIPKYGGQNRYLVYDSITGKIGYRYVSASGNFVPYTGATTDVDLGNFSLYAKSFHAKGTAGTGHLGLKHQSSSATASGNETVIYANSGGYLYSKNDGNAIEKIIGSNDTASMLSPYALSSEVPTYLAGNGILKGGVTFFRDSLKTTGQYGNSWQNGMFLGSYNNRSVRFRTNGQQRMLLDSSNGYLGIGTVTPSSILHLEHPTAVRLTIVAANSADFQVGSSVGGSDRMTVGYAPNIGYIQTAGGTYPLTLQRLGGSTIIGGTTTPSSSKLHIFNAASGSLATGLSMQNDQSANGSAIGIDFYNSSGTVTGRIQSIRTNTPSSANCDIAISNFTGASLTEKVRFFGSGEVSIGSSSLTASAKLSITSTTQGFLPPVMTNTQKTAISSPATGLTVYCTDCTATDASTGVMQTYNGSTWKNNW